MANDLKRRLHVLERDRGSLQGRPTRHEIDEAMSRHESDGREDHCIAAYRHVLERGAPWLAQVMLSGYPEDLYL